MRDLPEATWRARVEATLRLRLPPVSKPLTTLGRGGCPNTRLQPGKSAVPTGALLHTRLFEGMDGTGQNQGRLGEGQGLTLPRTVRHGFGSSSGCSSFTTPTQPYSYRSSSSLLLHRPSGCIWETSGEKASVGRLQAYGAPVLPVSDASVKSNLETGKHMGFQHNERNPGENTVGPLQIDCMDTVSLLCKEQSPKADAI